MLTEKINKTNWYMPLIRVTLIWSFPVGFMITLLFLLCKDFKPKNMNSGFRSPTSSPARDIAHTKKHFS